MPKMFRTGAVIALIATASLSAFACAQDNSKMDAKQPDKKDVDTSSAAVTGMPDSYPNVAEKCTRSGYRVFVTTHGTDRASNMAVFYDPRCPQPAGNVRDGVKPVQVGVGNSHD